MGNTSELRRNHNSLIASGGRKLDTGGVMIINDAKTDLSVRQQLQDTGRRMIHNTVVDTTSMTKHCRQRRLQ